MKKIIITVLCIITQIAAHAQTDLAKIEQYCQVIATPRLLSKKVTIEVDFGEEKRFWRDNRLKTYDGVFKKFNTVIDALNYMGKDGWVFINAYPIKNNDSEIYHYVFKKILNVPKNTAVE